MIPRTAVGMAAALLLVACAPRGRVARSTSPAPAARSTPPAPAARNVWDRQIRNAQDAGDGDYQLRVLRQRMAAQPEDIPVRLELVKAYLERGYPDVAAEVCRLAAARFPDSGEIQLALVRSLRALNLRAEAVRSLEDFLKAHPQNAPAYWAWLGLLRDESGQWPAGEPAHRRALELAPGLDYLHNNLGYNLLMQKKNDEAAGEFREALRLNPSSLIARNNLGLALARQNQAGQAVAQWETVAGPAAAHSNLAAVLIEKGNYSEARKELDMALGYNKAHPAALKNLELVSRLDGNPAALAGTAPETRWDRLKAVFFKLFVGPVEVPKAEPVKAASAPVTGEEQ